MDGPEAADRLRIVADASGRPGPGIRRPAELYSLSPDRACNPANEGRLSSAESRKQEDRPGSEGDGTTGTAGPVFS